MIRSAASAAFSKPGQRQHLLYSTYELTAEISDERSSQSAGGTRPGKVSHPYAGLIENLSCQGGHARFQYFHILRRSPFLRGKHSYHPPWPYERRIHIAEYLDRNLAFHLPHARHRQHSGPAVAGSRPTETYHDAATAVAKRIQQKFPKPGRAGDQGVAFLRRQQRKSAGLRHLDDGRIPGNAVFREHRSSERPMHRDSPEIPAQRGRKHIDRPFSSVRKRHFHHLRIGEALLYRHGDNFRDLPG